MRSRPPEWWPEGERWPPPSAGPQFRWWWLLPPLLLLGTCLSMSMPRDGKGFHWVPWFPLFFLFLFFLIGRRRYRPRWFPVRSLVSASARLAEGDYSVRVTDVEGGPLREVISSFNEMARRLESASEQRRRLLADLGHELRTPLTVLQGEIEALLDGVHPPDNEQLNRLLEEIAVMSRLLDDLRTLSLSEAGELQLTKEEVDLVDLVEDVARTYRGLDIEIRLETVPATVEADAVRLREVLSNLLNNAFRHSQTGDAVTVRIVERSGHHQIAVIDQGPGILPEVLPHVFERFVKGSDSTGTGLGLSIARDLVRAHGGEIAARNLPEGGTEISFTLPP